MIIGQVIAFLFWFLGIFIAGMGMGNLILNVGFEQGYIVEALVLAGIWSGAIIFGGYCVGKEIGTWNKTQG